MIAGPGLRWIIIVTLPTSGAKFACGGHEGKFALIPIGDGKQEIKISKALSWDDSLDAKNWLKEFMKQMSEETKKNFILMKPDLGKIAVAQ